MSDPTLSDLLGGVTDLLGRRTLTQQEIQAWWTGAANGGPNSDGRFPFTLSDGTVISQPSPARMLADLSAGGGLNLTSFNALPVATQAQVSAAPPQVLGVTSVGQLQRFTTDMFAARRTVDLNPLNEARVSDLLSVSRGGVEGSLNLGAIAKIANNLTINLASPPYNVVPDFKEVRDASITSGSNVINSASALFQPSDVGKLLLISNATSDGLPIATTVGSYVSPTRITMAGSVTPGKTVAGIRVGWGTDNTAGVRQACLDSEAIGQFCFGSTVIVPQGGILTRPFRVRARTTWMGYGDRQSFFVKAPALVGGSGLDGKGVSFIRNAIYFNGQTDAITGKTYTYADDFINFLQIGVNGAAFYQPGGDVVNTLELMSVLGSQTLAQDDPFWRMAFVSVWDSSGTAIHTYGRSSGNMGFINIINSVNVGWLAESFDDNVNTVVINGCGQTGLQLGPNGGSNSNYTTVKVSFCGTSGFSKLTRANVAIMGNGYVVTGFRIQESCGENLLVAGSNNQVRDGSIEDTGCENPKHGIGPAPLLRPAITLDNSQVSGLPLACYGNVIKGVLIGPQVHSADANGQFATHGLLLRGSTVSGLGSPKENTVDVTPVRPFGVIGITSTAITVTNWTWQNYGDTTVSASGPTGKDANSSYNLNSITLNGAAVTD